MTYDAHVRSICKRFLDYGTGLWCPWHLRITFNCTLVPVLYQPLINVWERLFNKLSITSCYNEIGTLGIPEITNKAIENYFFRQQACAYT